MVYILSHLHGQCYQLFQTPEKTDQIWHSVRDAKYHGQSFSSHQCHVQGAQVGITQNCTLSNVMQRQGQGKDKQAVRREQRRGVGGSSSSCQLYTFLIIPLAPKCSSTFFSSIIPLVLAVPFNLSVNASLFCKRER